MLKVCSIGPEVPARDLSDEQLRTLVAMAERQCLVDPTANDISACRYREFRAELNVRERRGETVEDGAIHHPV